MVNCQKRNCPWTHYIPSFTKRKYRSLWKTAIEINSRNTNNEISFCLKILRQNVRVNFWIWHFNFLSMEVFLISHVDIKFCILKRRFVRKYCPYKTPSLYTIYNITPTIFTILPPQYLQYYPHNIYNITPTIFTILPPQYLQYYPHNIYNITPTIFTILPPQYLQYYSPQSQMSTQLYFESGLLVKQI